MTKTLDKKIFTDHILENQNIIHKICNVYCFDQEDRKDLYQEIILQLYKSFSKFRHESGLNTWMYRVALNTAITMTKKQKKYNTIHDNTHDLDILHDEQHQNEDIELLYKAIHQLNKIDRAIILLWLEEKSYQEISDITGLTVKNISVKLVRIKNNLSEMITKIQ